MTETPTGGTPPTGAGGRIEPIELQTSMQRAYIDYAMAVIVGPGAARRARRSQAGAPPGALRDVRRWLPARPRLLQVLARGRRRHGSVPPARRHRDLRHPGPARAAVGDARPADPRPGQLRLAGQRRRGGDALHRVPDGAAGAGDGARHRRGDRRLPAQLRRPLAGADGPAGALPQPAGQRFGRHRGRHGHQHPAAQPARGRRGRPVGARAPRRHPRGAPGRADRADQGPRLPQRRADRRPRRASSRPTAPAAARSPSGR